MKLAKTVSSLLGSLGKKQKRFEEIIVVRNRYLCSHDSHYNDLKRITFQDHGNNLFSHAIDQYVFFVTVHDDDEIYYLSVAEKKYADVGLRDAEYALNFLHKYNDSGFHAL